MATAMLRYMREKGWKRVGTITSTDASVRTRKTSSKSRPRCRKTWRPSVDRRCEHFNRPIKPSRADGQDQAANPDVLVMWTSASVGTVTHAYIDAGLTIPAFTTNANMSFTFMKQFAGFLPKDLYFPVSPISPANSKEAMPRARADQAHVRCDEAAGTPVDFQAGIPWDPRKSSSMPIASSAPRRPTTGPSVHSRLKATRISGSTISVTRAGVQRA